MHSESTNTYIVHNPLTKWDNTIVLMLITYNNGMLDSSFKYLALLKLTVTCIMTQQL